MSDMTPDVQRIIAEGREWIDTPYLHHGRIKGKRSDCVGFIIGVGEVVLGKTLYVRYDYSAHPKSSKLTGEIGAVLEEQLSGRLQPGAAPIVYPGEVCAIQTGKQREPQHVCLIAEYDGRLTMIHAFNKEGRVVEHTLTDWWAKRICNIYRFPGMEY